MKRKERENDLVQRPERSWVGAEERDKELDFGEKNLHGASALRD